MLKFTKSNNILPRLKSGVSPQKGNVFSGSIHPRNKLRTFLEPSNKKNSKIAWFSAPDVQKRVRELIALLDLQWKDESKIYCFRSINAKTKAQARIWGLTKIWQKALQTEPAYIIEVISERFDRMNKIEQDKVLMHELAHIPKNFSGSLLPHYRRGKIKFRDLVNELVRRYERDIL